jgi:hypothetical protein
MYRKNLRLCKSVVYMFSIACMDKHDDSGIASFARQRITQRQVKIYQLYKALRQETDQVIASLSMVQGVRCAAVRAQTGFCSNGRS